MASLSLDRIHKTYGSGALAHAALNGVSLDIADGEFISLLGPSGSGKTTLLRAIAGLETIDAGNILIGAQLVSSDAASSGLHIPPEQRHVSVVFQGHALWPHMTVHENIAFPLLYNGTPSSEIKHRVSGALAAVELDGLAQRYPSQLSGGQRQRVALARAMVGEPKVMLFDEPLASLDTELRRDMMRQIVKARRSDMPMLYVTHNQEEALALSDRIAVMSDGQIAQLASPEMLCREPSSPEIAAFVGGGNVLMAQVLHAVNDHTVCLAISGHEFMARCRGLPKSSKALVCVSPTAVTQTQDIKGLEVRAAFVFFQGSSQLVETDLIRYDGSLFSCTLPLTTKVNVDDVLRLCVHDAWVIPDVGV
jgi:iron(III) transport system ATP-binding protein